MSGDSKIGLPAVGGIVRSTAPRRISGDAATPAPTAAPARLAATDAMPVARLIGLAQELGDQGPPVDVTRVAALRAAIADGRYVIDSDAIAGSMLRFHNNEAA